MKKILVILIFSLIINFNANAEFKWPKFMTKEIPVELLNKINDSSNNEIKDTLNKFDVKSKQMKFILMKTIIQTESAKMLMGNSELTIDEQKIIKKLEKKYLK